MRGERDVLSILEFDAFLLEQGDAAIDDGLVELEVGNAVAQQSASSLVFLEDCHAVTHQVQIVGSSKSSRASTNHRHLLTVTFDIGMRCDITLLEGHFNNGALILAVRGRLVVKAVQHAGLLTECWTDAPCELRERVGGAEQAISQFPVALI